LKDVECDGDGAIAAPPIDVAAVFADGLGGDDPLDDAEEQNELDAFKSCAAKALKLIAKLGMESDTSSHLDGDIADEIADACVADDLQSAVSNAGLTGALDFDSLVQDEGLQDDIALHIGGVAAFKAGVEALSKHLALLSGFDNQSEALPHIASKDRGLEWKPYLSISQSSEAKASKLKL